MKRIIEIDGENEDLVDLATDAAEEAIMRIDRNMDLTVTNFTEEE